MAENQSTIKKPASKIAGCVWQIIIALVVGAIIGLLKAGLLNALLGK